MVKVFTYKFCGKIKQADWSQLEQLLSDIQTDHKILLPSLNLELGNWNHVAPLD